MDESLTRAASIAEVRSRIANAVLGAPTDIPAALGAITLRERQRRLAGRLMRLLERHRGALLADPVGLGKTYTALAVARGFRRLVVVAPASLRDMWILACRAADIECAIVSHESLSRAAPTLSGIGSDTLIVVDEAHRFRNPATRRYARLTLLARDARLLLISATPIHNRLQDLAAPLALFAGAEAFALPAAELAGYVVREPFDPASDNLPAIAGPTRVPVRVDPTILRAILRLPPPLPASDEGVAAALVSQLLVRRWTSSQAALIESLRRLLAKALALRDASMSGRRIGRADLGLWELADDSVQLPFAALLGETIAGGNGADAAATLEGHAQGLRRLIRSVTAAKDADEARARALSEIRSRHSGERIVAFSQYARTVGALFTRVSASGGVAALTADGARIATGRITRAEAIGQFMPGGDSRSTPAAPIELLIATDLLSEGLNLQRASVVVHLDLPWNPARLDQRVGRVRRVGSQHDQVSVYVMDPVGAGRAGRNVEARLRAKLRIAGDTVGSAAELLPADTCPDRITPRAAAETLGQAQRLLERWRSGTRATFARAAAPDVVVVAAVRAAARGWLCAYGACPASRLLADVDGRVGDDARHVGAALEHACGVEAVAEPCLVAASIEAARCWIAAHAAARAVDLRAALTGHARRDLVSRIARAMARAPRHRRAAMARAAESARSLVTMPLGLAAEQSLHDLVAAELPDEQWLDAVSAFAAANARGVHATAARDDQRIVAMIVFECDARLAGT